MMGEIERFELESGEIRDGILFVNGRPSTWNSWRTISPRLGSLILASILVIGSICIFALFQILPTAAETSLKNPFEIDNHDDPQYCAYHAGHPDPAFVPYGKQIDRSICEEDDMYLDERLDWSETLRCYNLTYRLCFPQQSDGVKLRGWDTRGDACLYQFYENDGILYRPDGLQMPDSFRSKCSTDLSWDLWHSIQPTTGCGRNRLRFCNSDESINWTMVREGTGHPFNCLEFLVISLSQIGSESVWEVNNLCAEQANGCAERRPKDCRDDGMVDYANRSWDDMYECHTFQSLYDKELIGHQNEKGMDLICLP